MTVTTEEKISLGFWWVVGFAITAYLFLGIVNTLTVVLN